LSILLPFILELLRVDTGLTDRLMEQYQCYLICCVKSHQAELSILAAADIDLIIESLYVS